MKKIGLVIAVEMQAFNGKYGEPNEILWIRKQEVRKYIKNTYEKVKNYIHVVLGTPINNYPKMLGSHF